MIPLRNPWTACAATLLFLSTAAAEPILLRGKDSRGAECHLEVVSWGYAADGAPAWYNLEMSVRTSWSDPTHPPVVTRRSPTQYSLYGANAENKDRVAVMLSWGGTTPADVTSFLFQSWSPEDGRLQTHCRIK